MNILGRAHTIAQAQEQERLSRNHQAQQNFEAQRQQFSRASDEALGPMTFAEKAEMAERD